MTSIETPGPRSVSIVVPYYCDQVGLDRLFGALAQQRPSPTAAWVGGVEVVVADDGSPVAPCTDRSPFPTRVVRQPDRGFRAGAARNLGVAASTGEVLVFCDGDMAPEPGWLHAMADLSAPDEVVVGRRRHIDYGSCTLDEAMAFLDPDADRRTRCIPAVLPEPEWLAEGYRRTADLRRVDPENWRLVISASMSCSRQLFDELGGFDESFDHYGGEDWDLAYRALNCGAVLLHRPDAVAWHDGPDWAGRGPDPAQKRRERRMLAVRIPRPSTRPTEWSADDPLDAHEAGELLERVPGRPVPAMIITVTSGTDAVDGEWADTIAALHPTDVAWGAELRWSGSASETTVPIDQWHQRVRLHVDLRRPVRLPDGAGDRLLRLTEPGGCGRIEVWEGDETALVATATWHLCRETRRSGPASGTSGAPLVLEPLDLDPDEAAGD